jgi:glucosamine-6-phosphate deaminase
MSQRIDTIDERILGKLKVLVFENDDLMAERAAEEVAREMRRVLKEKPELNIILSGAESQEKFLQALSKREGIDWTRVNYFAVDEFCAPGMDPAFRVSAQPLRIFSHLSLKSMNVIDFAPESAEAERKRYEDLVRRSRPDIACLGIGVSGHIAFNEPGQTDFNGTDDVRIITVGDSSAGQLMEDPNFMKLGAIPRKAITVTIPFLMRCPVVSVVVPYRIKAPIVKRLFESRDVTEDFPATILKEKANAVLYLDRESYSLCQ